MQMDAHTYTPIPSHIEKFFQKPSNKNIQNVDLIQ